MSPARQRILSRAAGAPPARAKGSRVGKDEEEKQVKVLQARQEGEEGDRARPGQGGVLQVDGRRPGEVAVDGPRRGRQEPRRDQGAGKGRQRDLHGRLAVRGRQGVPEAALVAVLLQRLQVPQLPLHLQVEVRVPRGRRPGVRRRGPGGAEARRGHGAGALRARRVADTLRPRARPLPAADSRLQARARRRQQVHHLPLGGGAAA